MAYLETPRTDAGNETFAAGIGDISFEKSFISPKKRSHDLVSQMRNQRGQPLRTPSGRTALTARPNAPGNRRSGEFTPLLQSVAKRNAFHGKENLGAGPKTPAFLKSGYVPKESPALTNPLDSSVYGSDASFMADAPAELPQIASSSAQSTPVAQLPKGGQGVLDDQRNLMTLREQETVIDKVEKENFGLKLKIHFLEELLRKSDPNLNQNALKENTDLRVDKVQMQKELSKVKKLLTQSEKLAESMRQQLREDQAQAQKDQADQVLQEELTTLRTAYEAKQIEIETLKEQIDNDPRDREMGKLHDDIEDLEADLREKQRQIDTKDDEMDILNIKFQKFEDLEQQVAESQDQDEKFQELERKFRALQDEMKEKEEELDDLQETANDLKDQATRAKKEAEEANEDRDQAEREKQAAIDDLEELRGEMADKSFTTKGLSRQLEEKVTRLETENEDLKDNIEGLQAQLDQRSREFKQLQVELEEEKEDNDFNQRRLQNEIDALVQEQDAALQKHDSSSRSEIDQVRRDLRMRSDEKDLLQSRHDALTKESQSLQKDLATCRKQLAGLQGDLEEEKQMSQDSEHVLREEAKANMDRLSGEISALQRRLENERANSSSQKESWAAERREFQTENEKAEQRASGLQRTVERLQSSQGSLSNKESQLQKALESEQQRHRDEQSLQARQLNDLREELEKKRKAVDDNRSEVLRLKEEVRISTRVKDSVQDKIQALEDEVEVLQSSLEEEGERAKADVAAARQEAENLRRQLMSLKQELARMESAHADARAEIEAFQGDLKAGQGSKEQLNSRIRDVESQVTRLRNDKKMLQDEVCRLEQVQSDAHAEIDTFQIDLRAGKGSNEHLNSRIRELESQLARIRNDKQTLQDELVGANIELENLRSSADATDGGDASILRQDLAASRAKELESFQKEARLKEDVRMLRREISTLESRVHEAEIAKINLDSPKSFIRSEKKSELAELRRQLTDAQQQSTNLRRQLRDAEKISREAVSQAAAELVRHQTDAEAARDELEARIADLELQLIQQEAVVASNAQLTTRLRTRVQTLEKDLKEARNSTVTDQSIATERADLHRMLQEAKLEAEDMIQLATEQAEQLQVAEERETQLSAHLKRVREERSIHSQRAKALEQELGILLKRHEVKLNEMASMQQLWDQERDDIQKNVRLTEVTVSDITQRLDIDKHANLKAIHQKELEDISARLKWLKVKLQRESSHKRALAYEKQYLQKEIEVFEQCNRLNVKLLKKIIKNPPKFEKPMRTLRHFALVVVSSIRIRKLAEKWAHTRKRLRSKPKPQIIESNDDAAATRASANAKDSRRSKKAESSKATQGASTQPTPEQQMEQAPAPKQHEEKQHRSSKLEGKDADKVRTVIQETMKALNRRSSGRKAQVPESVSDTSEEQTQEKAREITQDLTKDSQQLDRIDEMSSFNENETSSLFDDMVSKMIGQHESQSNTRTTFQRDATSTASLRRQNSTKGAQNVEISESLPTFTDISFTRREKRKSGHTEELFKRLDGPSAQREKRQSIQPVKPSQSTKTINPVQQDPPVVLKPPRSIQRHPEPVLEAAESDSSTPFSDSVYSGTEWSGSGWMEKLGVRRDFFRNPTPTLTLRDLEDQTGKLSIRNPPASPDKTKDTDVFAELAEEAETRDITDIAASEKAHETTEFPAIRKTHEATTIHSDVQSEAYTANTIDLLNLEVASTREGTQRTDIVIDETDPKTGNADTVPLLGEKEWWARVKPGTERPFEGKMTVKWRGYVAQRDPQYANKTTPEKDVAMKRAMERLAMDRTMSRAMEEARAAVKEGALGKRKARGGA